jgi:hypothetical protein
VGPGISWEMNLSPGARVLRVGHFHFQQGYPAEILIPRAPVAYPSSRGLLINIHSMNK